MNNKLLYTFALSVSVIYITTVLVINRKNECFDKNIRGEIMCSKTQTIL